MYINDERAWNQQTSFVLLMSNNNTVFRKTSKGGHVRLRRVRLIILGGEVVG